MEKVMVFDTTLRDGEQSPGASLTVEEKLEIARQLERLRVDIIETGFPASSPGDFEAVRRITQEVKTPVIAALARALPSDIEKAGEALREAKHKRIHTFIATSSIHMEHKLRMSPRQVLSSAVEAVQFAKQFASEVEFSPEDASRSDLAFLCEVIQAVIETGATVVNIPDTVGYSTPDDFGTLIGKICEKVSHLDRITLSIHCHNDLGIATANSIAGIKAGARQVECTINGIGERAGNASLEEIVMALVTRSDLLPFCTNINTSEIYRTSRLVSRLTGIPVQPNKAIVGENAFRHEAGIHQDGVLKESATYEIMTPASIGLKEGELVLGKHSGRHAFKERMKRLGFRLDTHQLEAVFKRFKELTDKKREVFDEDLIFMGEEQTFRIPQVYVLEYIHTVTGNQVLPTATVRIKKKGKVFQEAACGDGPIDAAYRAIDRVTRMKLNLLDYSLHSVTGGKDALGEVKVKVEAKGRMVTGRGVSTDIIEAGAKAYLNAINRLIYQKEKRNS